MLHNNYPQPKCLIIGPFGPQNPNITLRTTPCRTLIEPSRNPDYRDPWGKESHKVEGLLLNKALVDRV